VSVSQGWWESKGREATFGGVPNFNATSFIFNMKNRFPADWRDKQDHELTGAQGGPIKTDSRFEIVLVPPDKGDEG